MQSESRFRRVSYLALCASLLVIAPLTAARPLRISGVYEVIGLIVFICLVLCAWALSRPPTSGSSEQALVARFAGFLFLTPFGLVALLWVGLATPWDATTIENRMRYAVLVTASVAVTGAFVVAKEALSASSNRLFPALTLAAGTLSGAAYLVWTSFYLGVFASKVSTGQLSPVLPPVMNILDVLLFVASALAYLATAALAHSLRRANWLRTTPAATFVLVSAIAFTFLMLRGLAFPSPNEGPTPWYMRPGFIAGIPAVPWLMPYLLGIVLLRQAGQPKPTPDRPLPAA